MADVFVVDMLRRRSQRRSIQLNWRLVDRLNPFELNDVQFKARFRLSKEATLHLIRELKEVLSVTSSGYSVELQVLNTLRILGSGSFQNVVSDGIFTQISPASSSRCLDKVVEAIFLLRKKYIKFPTTSTDTIQVSHKFFQRTRFPNVVGAIDCTHIRIKKPSCPDSFVYINRKGNYSLNVQMVCGADLRILDVVARWPGSSHDSFIWQMSNLRDWLSQNHRDGCGYLLGDSGYPLEPWLLTPYGNPCAPQESLFNKKHAMARNVIERCFGVIKARFRLFHQSGGTLLYCPLKACRMIIASAVLHNICILFNVDIEDDEEIDDDDIDNDNIPHHQVANNPSAAFIRDDLALRFQMGT